VAREYIDAGVDIRAREFRRLLPPSSLVTDLPLESSEATQWEVPLSWCEYMSGMDGCGAVLDRGRLVCSAPSMSCGERGNSSFLFSGDFDDSVPRTKYNVAGVYGGVGGEVHCCLFRV
jgi:hypothetical protein